MTQICKLCDQSKNLIKAHIIPKWAFNYIKEDNHFFQVSGMAKKSGDLNSRKIQDGYKDTSILCKKCDGDIIGPYDTYAKKFFDQDFLPKIKRVNHSSGKGVSHIHINDFDYIKLKLFLLSVLWRASISTLDHFSAVQLGKYEDRIKSMILNGSITDDNIFQIGLATWESPKTGFGYEKAILSPLKRKFGAAKGYSIIMAGFEVLIKVGKANSSMHIEGLNIVHPNGFHVLVTDFESSTIGKLTKKIKQERQKTFSD